MIKKAHHEIWQKPTDTSPYFGTTTRTSQLCECEFQTLFNAALADSQQYVIFKLRLPYKMRKTTWYRDSPRIFLESNPGYPFR